MSLDEYYRTFTKIEKLCAKVIPGHDIRVLDHTEYPLK